MDDYYSICDETDMFSIDKLSAVIPNDNAPIFIPYRYCCAGGTMLIRRLVLYLLERGYSVEPVCDFLPKIKDYSKRAKLNMDSFFSGEAAHSNSVWDIYLWRVLRNEQTICYIIDFPGEHQFNHLDGSIHETNPAFLGIVNSNHPVCWGYIFEKEIFNNSFRNKYIQAIVSHKIYRKKRDQVLFIYNKIDTSPFMINHGKVNTEGARRHLMTSFPELFSLFRNSNPFTRIIRPFLFDFVTFSSGSFLYSECGKTYFQKGSDVFPYLLMKRILALH